MSTSHQSTSACASWQAEPNVENDSVPREQRPVRRAQQLEVQRDRPREAKSLWTGSEI